MVRVQLEGFDVGAEIASFGRGNHGIGGIATFVGMVRELHDDTPVRAMTLEHYPGMTERQLEVMETEARQRWPLDDVLIVHRHGRMLPGEVIVLVATASAHRAAALDSCAFLIDQLKTRAPFWKMEETPSGERWIDGRESDNKAAARWR